MAANVQTVRETKTAGNGVTQTRRVVQDSETGATAVQDTVSRAIWFVATIILILLGFRFVLALLGANPGNSFAHFIYSVSHPFVAPFFGLFSYNYHYGVSRFEAYTLVAALVYIVLAWLIVSVINLNRSDVEA